MDSNFKPILQSSSGAATDVDVYFHFEGWGHQKIKAKTMEEAIIKADAEVNPYSIVPEVEVIANQKKHKIFLDEVDVRYADIDKETLV